MDTSKDTSPETSVETSVVRIPIRINKKVTSVTIKKNLLALWLLLGSTVNFRVRNSTNFISTNELKPIISNFISDSIKDFVYSCLDEWKGNTAKGFSDFVSDKLIQECLEQDDYTEFEIIKKLL